MLQIETLWRVRVALVGGAAAEMPKGPDFSCSAVIIMCRKVLRPGGEVVVDKAPEVAMGGTEGCRYFFSRLRPRNSSTNDYKYDNDQETQQHIPYKTGKLIQGSNS